MNMNFNLNISNFGYLCYHIILPSLKYVGWNVFYAIVLSLYYFSIFNEKYDFKYWYIFWTMVKVIYWDDIGFHLTANELHVHLGEINHFKLNSVLIEIIYYIFCSSFSEKFCTRKLCLKNSFIKFVLMKGLDLVLLC